MNGPGDEAEAMRRNMVAALTFRNETRELFDLLRRFTEKKQRLQVLVFDRGDPVEVARLLNWMANMSLTCASLCHSTNKIGAMFAARADDVTAANIAKSIAAADLMYQCGETPEGTKYVAIAPIE